MELIADILLALWVRGFIVLSSDGGSSGSTAWNRAWAVLSRCCHRKSMT